MIAAHSSSFLVSFLMDQTLTYAAYEVVSYRRCRRHKYRMA